MRGLIPAILIRRKNIPNRGDMNLFYHFLKDGSLISMWGRELVSPATLYGPYINRHFC